MVSPHAMRPIPFTLRASRDAIARFILGNGKGGECRTHLFHGLPCIRNLQRRLFYPPLLLQLFELHVNFIPGDRITMRWNGNAWIISQDESAQSPKRSCQPLRRSGFPTPSRMHRSGWRLGWALAAASSPAKYHVARLTISRFSGLFETPAFSARLP